LDGKVPVTTKIVVDAGRINPAKAKSNALMPWRKLWIYQMASYQSESIGIGTIICQET
jgi:hypothetical protein